MTPARKRHHFARWLFWCSQTRFGRWLVIGRWLLIWSLTLGWSLTLFGLVAYSAGLWLVVDFRLVNAFCWPLTRLVYYLHKAGWLVIGRWLLIGQWLLLVNDFGWSLTRLVYYLHRADFLDSYSRQRKCENSSWQKSTMQIGGHRECWMKQTYEYVCDKKGSKATGGGRMEHTCDQSVGQRSSRV